MKMYDVRIYFVDGEHIRYPNVIDLVCNDIRYKIECADKTLALVMIKDIKYIEIDTVED